MPDNFGLSPEDKWQIAYMDAIITFREALYKLHISNPWPDDPVMDSALSYLATELWDWNFGLSKITAALRKAADDLPRYAAGEENQG